MKKIFTFIAAALLSVSLFAQEEDPNREYISLDPSEWGWGYNSVSGAVADGLQTTIISDWGAVSTGWNPSRDLSEWDKIVIEVSHMDGCAGEWFKLKAYLRDESESETNQMEGLLGLDAPDNELNYLVIDLHQDKACDITKARILAVQCEPTGGIFTISSVYLLKESEPAVKYYVVGTMTDWNKDEAFEMVPNNFAATEEYKLDNVALTAADQFKVVKIEGTGEGETWTWLPDGSGNNYGEHGEITIAANYNIYFRPNADGGEGWFYNYIYADRQKDIRTVSVAIKVPAAGCPDQVQMIGSFGKGWDAEDAGVTMTFNPETGYFNAELQAEAYDEFKIRQQGSWDNQLQVYVPANDQNPGYWKAMDNIKFGDYWADGEGDAKTLTLDFSDRAQYCWTVATGIENIVLTEKAQKVVVDGVLYIVRDNKLFNLQGAQVK